MPPPPPLTTTLPSLCRHVDLLFDPLGLLFDLRRRLIQASTWGPLALLACFTYRHQNSSNAEIKSVLDTLLGAVSKGVLSPAMKTVMGDIAGLVLLREVLKYALATQRCLLNAYTNTNGQVKWGKVIQRTVLTYVMALGKKLPVVSGIIEKEVAGEVSKMEKDLDHEFSELKAKSNLELLDKMPESGIPAKEISDMMDRVAVIEDKMWESGRCSGAVYHGERDHLKLLNKAYAAFSLTNPLHPDIWPSSMKFEAEVVKWVANMMRGDDDGVCGALTSGGTESIILAAKSHRDKFREEYNITQPEIIACTSAHAAIDKACDLMGIKLVKVPMNKDTYEIDMNAVSRALTADTIMIYSSAPNFPNGIIDPIKELSEMAVARGVGLHVDCCLGGFILPFAKKLNIPGVNIPDFDFGLPGVTSMSVDTHKYGYASKGTSVVLYRDSKLRKYQYFAYPDWTGGLYVTPTIAGSRPGALTAACWASLATLGQQGFMERTREIIECRMRLQKEVEKIDGLFILGNPQAMILCFGSNDFPVLNVGDLMSKKGWSLNSLQHPDSIHLCCTVRTCGPEVEADFITDLKACVAQAAARALEAPEEGGNAAIYGMASGMPSGPVKELMYTYTDAKLKA
mmetsp:Transcript_90238/g.258011  ORF Transcript_90238/g.258011 Transcript_90238/m.258011 type:complete len:626 (-) Transcript_90238:160-2037(-)|eukprot:CAMPEP_0119538026 /NCGR_PEP_ID=MMETSP1344-20130328/50556_1 /TAXON_ID=236787 /ORGANISM="Florenciella parvula, Strain CCMP2471" /LENGTH=625 /DNA_ID=CAMNT_0007580757 /DNA_START=55 /DNA_END=1932 /DNA_ORIENTATION=-